MEGSHYEYAIFETVEDAPNFNDQIGGPRFVGGLYYELKPAQETLAVLRTFKCNEDRKLYIRKRLVMAWEPVEEDKE